MVRNNNFRKWIVFNEGLTSRVQVENLIEAIDRCTSLGSFKCEIIHEEGSEKFSITETITVDTLVLTDIERREMLDYLRTHFLTNQVDTPQLGQVQSLETVQLGTQTEPKTKFHHPLFTNRSIKRHVLGWACMGIVLLQFFIIPTNVFGIKFTDSIRIIWLLTFSIITFLAVQNYKHHFLIGGIRYTTVWSITFWLYTYIFGICGIELAIIDGSKGMNSIYFIVPIILGAAYLSGWILSFPIFFLSGGKIVTDPSKIKFRE